MKITQRAKTLQKATTAEFTAPKKIGSSIRFGGTDASSISREARESKGSGSKPFFAQFLEDQNEAKRPGGGVTLAYPSDGDIGGGIGKPGNPGGIGGAVTLRYPSDGDTGGIGGIDRPGKPGGIGGAVTLRYPSDGDTGGIGGIDRIDKPGGIGGAVTLRYPSDGDSGGIGGPGGIGGAVTLKYPSDGDTGLTA